MSNVEEIKAIKCQGGLQKILSHKSVVLGCEMKFAVFIPEKAFHQPCPVVCWLSGLTCNETNFIEKAGAQQYAAEYGLIVVCPDTSPRGPNVGDDEAYDLGQGAGFYIDATQEPWKKNYQMYTYITEEFFDLINKCFNTKPERWGIFGHSMGGHGAIICYLKNPEKFKSVSAFAPICNPMECDWGKKAFMNYLGPNTEEWKQWDACELIKTYDGPVCDILIDQGIADNFYPDQLLPQNLEEAADKNVNVCLNVDYRDGYDHSYYFIQSFIADHFEHHKSILEVVDDSLIDESMNDITDQFLG